MSASASPEPNTAATHTVRPSSGRPSPWVWMILACLLLAASGAIRISQEQRFHIAAAAVETPPFPMKDLPEVLGHWRMQGEEQKLAEETIEVAGCSDYMARSYVDDRTGVALSVLVAFGPAERVFPHPPTVCFPSFGYTAATGAQSHVVEASSQANESDDALETADGPVRFESVVYSKPTGGGAELVEVYYSFRHAGQWSPHASNTQKQFRHQPAMFKVQVQRPIAPREAGAQNSPIEDFLAELVPEIERRLAAAENQASE